MTIVNDRPGLLGVPLAASQPETTLVGQLHRARLERRTELAQQQIRDARAEPTVAELETQAGDAQLPNGCTCTSQWKSLTWTQNGPTPVSYTHLRAHETPEHLVCRLLLE